MDLEDLDSEEHLVIYCDHVSLSSGSRRFFLQFSVDIKAKINTAEVGDGTYGFA